MGCYPFDLIFCGFFTIFEGMSHDERQYSKSGNSFRREQLVFYRVLKCKVFPCLPTMMVFHETEKKSKYPRITLIVKGDPPIKLDPLHMVFALTLLSLLCKIFCSKKK